MQIKNTMRVWRRNHRPISFSREFAILEKRVALELGFGGPSHSDHILQRHGITGQHNPISAIAAEKSIHAI